MELASRDETGNTLSTSVPSTSTMALMMETNPVISSGKFKYYFFIFRGENV